MYIYVCICSCDLPGKFLYLLFIKELVIKIYIYFVFMISYYFSPNRSTNIICQLVFK